MKLQACEGPGKLGLSSHDADAGKTGSTSAPVGRAVPTADLVLKATVTRPGFY